MELHHRVILSTFFVSIISAPLTMAQGHSYEEVQNELKKQAEELKEKANEQLVAVFEKITSDLDQTKTAAQSMMISLNQQAIKVAEPQKAMEWLKHTILSSIAAVQKVNIIPLDQQKIFWFLVATADIISALKKGMETSFAELPTIYLTPYIETRKLPREEQIIFYMNSTQQNLQEIEKLSSVVGLTWYNKVFRSLRDGINSKLAIGSTVLASATFGILRVTESDRLRFLYGTRKEKTMKEGTCFKPDVLASVLLGRPIGTEETGWIPDPMLKEVTNFPKHHFNPLGAAVGYGTSNPLAGTSATDPATLNLAGKIECYGLRGLQWFVGYKMLKTSVLPTSLTKPVDDFFESISISAQKAWNELAGTTNPITQEEKFKAITDERLLDEKGVIGLEEQREQLQPYIHYLLNQEHYKRTGRSKSIQRGLAFTGPSRSGKSLTLMWFMAAVNRMAADQGMPDLVRFFQIQHYMINSATWHLRELFEQAKMLALQGTAVAFYLDEAHLLKPNRTDGTGFLAELLMVLDEIHRLDLPILFIIASNNQSQMDSALFKKDRFGTIIRFKLPSVEEREQFFIKRLILMGADSKDFDIPLLARRTSRASYGDLSKTFDDALLATKNKESLKQKHLEEAIASNIRLISKSKDNSSLSATTQKHIVCHLAGATLALHLLQPSEKLDLVTTAEINPEFVEIAEWTKHYRNKESDIQQYQTVHGNVFTISASEELSESTRGDLLNLSRALLAGKAAEDLILKDHLTTYRSWATQRAYDNIRQYLLSGRSDEKMSQKELYELNKKSTEIFEQCINDARTLLQEHQPALERLIVALTNKTELTDQDVAAIVNTTA